MSFALTGRIVEIARPGNLRCLDHDGVPAAWSALDTMKAGLGTAEDDA